MTANIDNLSPESYADQLSALENRLDNHADDESMLEELAVAIRSLLADNGESESHIRQMLQKQFNNGRLRPETYELVQNLLGKIVTEEAVKSPLPDSSIEADEIFAATAVIEDQAQEQAEAFALTRAKVAQPEIEIAATADIKQPQIGSVLRDRFVLQERVSEGSMGIVYKALDRRLAETGDADCFVAIKVLSTELCRNASALRALQQEAAKGRCLAHPNIVRFIDLDREQDLYFIVMEWLEGRSLARILDDKGGNALDVDTALNIVQQTARALDYAHQRGVIHADVKPGNIIVTPEGIVKLIDFGVARVRQKEQEGNRRSDPAALQTGTPAYSSMQVLTGDDPTPADDVFSLACLFYRLVAGYRVFGPRNAAQAAEDGMEPQRPQSLTAAQWQPVKKALSYSRVTRFESPQKFTNALLARSSNAKSVAITEHEAETPVAEVPDIREVLPQKTPKVRVDVPLTAAKDEPLDDHSASGQREFIVPIRAEADPIMFDADDDEPRSSGRALILFAVLATVIGVVATQTDLVDQFGQTVETLDVSPITDAFNEQREFIDAPGIDESAQDITEFVSETDQADIPTDVDAVAAAATEPVLDDRREDSAVNADTLLEENVVEQASDIDPEPVAPVVEQIDWSALPAPSIIINLGDADGAADSVELAIREDGANAIVDFVRADAAAVQTIVIRESRFTGNRSPLETGQYMLENDGQVVFDAGQERTRTSISMRSNPVRESDRDVTLTVSDSTSTQITLATIKLRLEDDDQRAFEEGLPTNTVAFAVNQISVRESDPAAQIDVLRYNPDNTSLEVVYELINVTATEGQDYFAPDITAIYFGPGQRTARILIPLGQDARAESDEAFMLELDGAAAPANAGLFSQIAVMIRDDDT